MINADSEKARGPLRRPWAGRRALGRVGFGTTALAQLGLTLSVFSFGRFPADAATLWMPHYLLLFLIGAVFCFAARRFRCAAVGLLGSLTAAAMIAPLYLPPAYSQSEGASIGNLRILQANVYSPGSDPEPLLALIRETKPNVVLLQEVDEKWRALLAPLERMYPNKHYSPRYVGGGLDLAQYWDGAAATVEELAPMGIPGTTTVLRVNNRRIRLFNVHTAAPFTYGRAQRHREQMKLLTRQVAARAEPIVLAGDFNSSHWSWSYRQLTIKGGLISARQGRGILGAWPSFLGPLRIALDHLLTSPELAAVHCRVGPGIGSDHLPLITDISVPPRQ